ncbi:MAG: NAD(P)-binding domain-containing protein [Bdellovibrionales bacterium]|nr:NAD(P)-binding domain-containing protein [Bdellovibrionales bacterium]
MQQTDVVIVGAGPIGIELAANLKKRGIDYIHVEAGQVGGTIDWYAPDTMFFSSSERIAIAGIPLNNTSQTKATREEYLTYLRGVVQQLKLEIRTYCFVRSVTPTKDGNFKVSLSRSLHAVGGPQESSRSRAADEFEEVTAKRVVLAIGDMHAPRLLNIPGEDLPHVSHYLEDPHKYFAKKVLIVGGKNSAVEAAIRLFRVGCDVTLSYRGAALDESRVKYWLLPEIKGLVKRNLIHFVPGSSPVEITPESALLESGGGPLRVPADFVLLLTGYQQDSSLFESAGVQLEGEGKKPSYSRRTMETNVQGLYVAGTAAAGTQIGGVKEFIETSHIHVARITAALCGEAPPKDPEVPAEYQLET